MYRRRAYFSQPYWEFVLPLLSWIGLAPLIFMMSGDSVASLYTNNPDFPLFYLLHSNLSLYAVASVSISLMAWAVNRLINNHTLIKKRSYLPTLLVVFYSSLMTLFSGFSCVYLAIFFLVLSLDSMFRCSRELRSLPQIFNSGFLLGLGLLIDFRIWFGGILLLLCLVLLRTIKPRDFVVFALGLLNVFAIYAAGLYLLQDRIVDMNSLMNYWQQQFPQDISMWSYFLIGGVSFLYFYGLVRMINYVVSMNNKTKDRFRLFVLFFSILVIYSLIHKYLFEGLSVYYYLIPLLGLLASMSLLTRNKRIIFYLINLIHFILIVTWVSTFFKR